MSNVTTGPTRVDLVEVATGVQVSRWPVDARELLATGEYVRAEDYVAPDTEPAAPEGETAGTGEQPDPDAGSETATEGDESVSTNRRRR